MTRLLLGLIILLGLGSAVLWGLREGWRALTQIDVNLAVAVVAGGATVLTSTGAIVLGRYFERKRDIEAHFRSDKIKIYDEFLKELFKLFHSTGTGQRKSRKAEADASARLVDFLREWQRKLIVWGGPNVLRKYFEWVNHLKRGEVNATTVFLMDEFFKALRSDIGLSSAGLPRGFFANLILRHADVLLAEAAKNPAITFAELTEIEEQKFGKTQ